MDIQATIAEHERRLLNHKEHIQKFGSNENALYDQFNEHDDNIKKLMMAQVAMYQVLTQMGVGVPRGLAELGTTFQRATGPI